MKKKISKLTILALALTLLCGITIGANAADTLQEIKAYIDTSITVTLEGQAQTFTDANGVRVFPITYNGTTYLPVRAVAGLVGLDVNWDQATKTVALGKTKGVDLIDTYVNYNRTNSNNNFVANQVQTGQADPVTISGVNCSKWLQFFIRDWNGDNNTVSGLSFNLGGKHDTLTFSYYSADYCRLQVLGDNGTLLFETDVNGGEIAQTVTVPLLKTSQLTLQITNVDWGAKANAFVFDAYLDAE